ncbi:MAG: GyrI-like domain-containing protein [Solobacterium sp.]|nr:GyrI-like domain-containing protein [Solobacterium sp.]
MVTYNEINNENAFIFKAFYIISLFLFTYDEGLCVQCMHIGPYDDKPATVQLMHDFMEQKGYELDITDKRLHHEIYLSDARKTTPEKLRTIIRHPIKVKGR